MSCHKEDSNLKSLQKIEYENLKFFVKICEKHHLRYCMIGGSLIGVIRHQGFIPWDDDIDIGMPRKDYNKFLSIVSQYLPDYMETKTKTSNPNYKCYFTRLINNKRKIYWEQGQYTAKIGVWMDIFPLDGLPNNKFLRYLHVYSIYFCKMLYKFTQIDYVTTNKKRSKIEWLLIKFAKITKMGKLLSADKLLDKIDYKLQRYDYDKSTYAWNYSGGHGFKEIMPRTYWDGGRIGKFENINVSIPVEAERHLKYIFGDYMTLPPVEERVSHTINFVD